MTDSPTPPRVEGVAEGAQRRGGEVRDLGYQRYDGARLPHRSRYKMLVARTLALAWQNGLVKTTVILGMAPLIVCGVWVFVKVKAMQALASQGVPLQIEDPGRWVFYCIYWCQIWFAFAMSLLVAAPAISDDVRTGAFQFYFARPVSKTHYLVGKMIPVAVLVLLVCAAPALGVALLRLALCKSGEELTKNLPWLLGTLGYAPIYAAVFALPPVAMSALSRRSGTVQGTWAAVFFLPWILGEGMAAATDLPQVALVSIPTSLRLLGQYIYGIEPSYPVGWYYPAAVIAGLLVLSAFLLLRRLERVEVFT